MLLALLSIVLCCLRQILSIKQNNCIPLYPKCPFDSDKELFKHYSKGLLGTEYDNMTFIYCVNKYYTCGHVIEDIDQEFSRESGVFIGSGIDLSKIKDELGELKLEWENLIEPYTKEVGEKAKHLLEDNPLSLTETQIDELNSKVYAHRYKQLIKQFPHLKITPSIELALLAYYVKYYNHKRLTETLPFIKEGQWSKVAYYIFTMKGSHRERKLLSLAFDSFEASHEAFYHFGILFDGKISSNSNWETEKDFIINLTRELKVRYTISSSIKNLLYNKQYAEVESAFKKYKYEYIEQEKLKRGIEAIQSELKREEVFNVYYQKILLLFINQKPDDNTIDLSELYDNRISIYIIGVLTDKLTMDDLNKIAGQYASVIPLKQYSNFIKDKTALNKMFHSALMNQIEVVNFRQALTPTKEIMIKNLTITKPSSHKYFFINVNSSDKFKYHIQMIYHNRIPIDMNIFVSSSNPYPDFYNNNNMHLGLSVEKPFLNFASQSPFYMGVLTNELNYSLIINKCGEKEDCEISSNGLYNNNSLKIIKSRSYNYFSFENCTRKICLLNYQELLTKYSRGIVNEYNDESLYLYDKKYYFNLEIFNCLFDNNYCGYINAIFNDKGEYVHDYGVMLGMSLNLSQYNHISVYQEFGLSKAMINKLSPFLNNSDIQTPQAYVDKLEAINLNFTIEEIRRIDKNTITHEYQVIEKLVDQIGRCYEQFSDDIKFALLLNKFDKSKVNMDKNMILDMCNGDFSSYLRVLYSKKNKDDERSINFQAMLINFSVNEIQSYKTMISIVVGKWLIADESFVHFIDDYQFNEMIISVSYYDSISHKVVSVSGFNDKKQEILEAISKIKEEISESKLIDIDIVLKHQIDLFNYYDYGFKKVGMIITDYVNDNNLKGTKSIKPPSMETVDNLKKQGINIIQLTNQNDIITDDSNDNSNDNNNRDWLFISNKVYYTTFDEISIDELSRAIHAIRIPITQLKPLVTDLQKGEYAYYELFFQNESGKSDDDDDDDDDDDHDTVKLNTIIGATSIMNSNENAIRLTFDSKDLFVFISKEYPYPSLDNCDIAANGTKTTGGYWNISIPFDTDKSNMTFYMTLYASENISYLRVDIEKCDIDGVCGTIKTKKIIAGTFILAAVIIIIYGIYNCFFDIKANIKTNIYHYEE